MRPLVLHWLAHHLRGDAASILAPSWFTCVGLAGLAALTLMLVLARRRGIDAGAIASIVLWCYVAAVVAGIVMPMAIDAVEDLVMNGRIRVHWAGMTSFWGYLAGTAAIVLVCRRDGVPLVKMADLAVIPGGVALVFARLGCFMAGCDYGKVSSLPWAMRFPKGSPAWRDQLQAGLIPADRAESLPVHPTELYEALIGIAIVVIGIVLFRRQRRDGQVFLVAATTYSIGRLFNEMLRGDAGRGIYAGFSSGQIFCMLVLLAIAARFLVTRRRARMVTAIAAASLVLAVANVGEADAQPQQPFGPQPQPYGPPPAPDGSTDQPTIQAPSVQQQAEPYDQPGYVYPQVPPAPPLFDPIKPMFSMGGLVGLAAPINRHNMQVPSLSGASLSFGYTPNWFGLWFDLESFSSTEATHGTMLLSVSFAPRVTGRLKLGARVGLGMTQVNFLDPAFRDVSGKTARVEALAEYALSRNWALAVRPLSIDTVSASELGGPITTLQFRIGIAYRWGKQGTRTPQHAAPQLPPVEPVPPPPTPPELAEPDPNAQTLGEQPQGEQPPGEQP
jgi:prolipoprotein diacylglyceryltransferase